MITVRHPKTFADRIAHASFALLAGATLQLGVVPLYAQSTEDHLAAARAELKRRSDGDSLAAAGLLTTPKDSTERLSLLARAAEAAPNRPDIVWLRVMLCQAIHPCDSEPFERRLLELDPANGAAWLAALSRAADTKDKAGFDQALIGLAGSDRVDLYWTTLINRMSGAVYETGRVPLHEAAVAIIGAVAAQAIPAYTLISQSCKDDALKTAARAQQCRGVSRSLRNGDTAITEMIGVAIAKRVWSEHTPEWNAADEERRVYDFRSNLWRDSAVTADNSERFVTLCGEFRREQDVLRAQIVAAGENPDPPAPL